MRSAVAGADGSITASAAKTTPTEPVRTDRLIFLQLVDMFSPSVDLREVSILGKRFPIEATPAATALSLGTKKILAVGRCFKDFLRIFHH